VPGVLVNLEARLTIGGLELRSATVGTKDLRHSTLIVTGATVSFGSSVIFIMFSSLGSVSVMDTGTLDLMGNGVRAMPSTARFDGGAGAIRIGGAGSNPKFAFVLGEGAQFEGGVEVAFSDADGILQDGRVEVAAGATVTASGANTFYGGSYLQGIGTFEVLPGSTLHWTSDPMSAASMLDAGVTRIDVGATLRVDGLDGGDCASQNCGGVNLGDGTHARKYNRVIRNDGTTILENAGYIAADGGTVFINCGTFEIDNDKGYFEGVTTNQLKDEFDDCAIHAGPRSGKMIGPDDASVGTIAAQFKGAMSDGRPGYVRVVRGTLRLFGAFLPGADVVERMAIADGTTADSGCGGPGGDCEYYTSLPHATSVQNSTKGSPIHVTIVEADGGGGDLGFTSTVTSPTTVSAAITLEMDESIVGGRDPDSIVVQNYGVVVPACSHHGQVGPDPCIDSRVLTTEGDIDITLLTDDVAGPESGLCCKLR
jgi:hypothetical protein